MTGLNGHHRLPSPDAGDRVLDLLTEELSAGLSGEDAGELNRLLNQGLNRDFESLEVAAAACAIAFGLSHDGADEASLPERVRERCLGASVAVRTESRPAARPMTVQPPPRLSFSPRSPAPAAPRRVFSPGWLAAAACLVLAVTAWIDRGAQGVAAGPAPAGAADPVADRRAMLAEGTDLVRWSWSAWDDRYQGVSGDVVWSESRQEGYMELVGLPANDPGQNQYQLWIIESSRGEPLKVAPVDGGVFDVPTQAGPGGVVVPIAPKLLAKGVAAFAVTLEPPGGVVVSDQTRRVVIAKAG
jgi:hypothetical protein